MEPDQFPRAITWEPTSDGQQADIRIVCHTDGSYALSDIKGGREATFKDESSLNGALSSITRSRPQVR